MDHEGRQTAESRVDRNFVYRVAAAADVSHHSVDKYLRGEYVRGSAGLRIRAVLDELGVSLHGEVAP